jgi:hypothetical protein
MSNAYPEHDKLQAVKDKSQAIGAFLEWLGEQGLELCRMHKHTDICFTEDDEDQEEPTCGLSAGQYVTDHQTIEHRLAAYFDIDLNKLEDEKREMLKALREGAK